MPEQTYHIAQVNIGRIRAPLDDPIMADFVNNLTAINALGRIAPPVEVTTLPGEEEQMEFRVPVELLDVESSSKIGKDGSLGHSSPAEVDCR